MTDRELMQQALEALELLCVKCRSNEWGPDTPRKEILNWMHDHASKAHTALRERLAQPKQKPVAWMDEFGNVFPLGAQRGPKHLNEPMKPLYTTPQRREWVGLTRDEVLDIEETTQHPLAFYRAIEAKLKEKNA